jgi:hypothetical protein
MGPLTVAHAEKGDCKLRILQAEGIEFLAESRLMQIRRQLQNIALSQDDRAENNFLAAKIYWTLGPQMHGTAIRGHLDQALSAQPLHYEARMLSVSLSLFEDSLGLDPYAISVALAHIRELMTFPIVIANTELFQRLQEQDRDFDRRLRRSGPKLPHQDILRPAEELHLTENLIWEIGDRAESYSDETPFQADVDSRALHEMVERFGRRVVAFFLEKRPVDGVMGYTHLIRVLYEQTTGLPNDLRESLLTTALEMAGEFSAMGKSKQYSELTGWVFQVSKQLQKGVPTLRTVTWIDLFVAGHLSAGNVQAGFWEEARKHFILDQAYKGNGDCFFLDGIIIKHLNRLADGP